MCKATNTIRFVGVFFLLALFGMFAACHNGANGDLRYFMVWDNEQPTAENTAVPKQISDGILTVVNGNLQVTTTEDTHRLIFPPGFDWKKDKTITILNFHGIPVADVGDHVFFSYIPVDANEAAHFTRQLTSDDYSGKYALVSYLTTDVNKSTRLLPPLVKYFPVGVITSYGYQMGIKGEIQLRDGYLRLGSTEATENLGDLLIWPENYSLSQQSGVICVNNNQGIPVARNGEEYIGSGGYISALVAEAYIQDFLPDDCIGPYIMVTDD